VVIADAAGNQHPLPRKGGPVRPPFSSGLYRRPKAKLYHPSQHPGEFAMNKARFTLVAVVVLAGVSTSGLANAQTPSGLPAKPHAVPATTTSPEPSTAKKVETWTQKQWDTAQKEWSKDKAKWAGCQKQSHAQDLSGRKSWSFLYQCMTG
jgi:hypothetical protein